MDDDIDWAVISLKDLAGFLTERLRLEGIDTVLVGGACVTIYSENRYQSYDLDFVTYEDMKKLKEALSKVGFYESDGYFRHENCPWVVEFVSPPIAVGEEFLFEFAETKTPYGMIKLLHPIDCVKDRLASFYHWNDKQALEQAINVCFEQKMDFKELGEWSRREGAEEKFAKFVSEFKKRKLE